MLFNKMSANIERINNEENENIKYIIENRYNLKCELLGKISNNLYSFYSNGLFFIYNSTLDRVAGGV